MSAEGVVGVLLSAVLFGGLAALVVLAVVLGIRHQRLMNERWSEWARIRGLALSGSYPMVELAGTLHGLGVQMVTHRYVHRSRRGRRVSYKHEVIATPHLPLGDLTLSREGFFASIGKVFGGQDIVTGDPAFDAAFVVRSANEPAARAVLTPAVRAALLDAQRLLGDVHVEAGGVRALRQGTASPDTLDGLFEAVARAAHAFGA